MLTITVHMLFSAPQNAPGLPLLSQHPVVCIHISQCCPNAAEVQMSGSLQLPLLSLGVPDPTFPSRRSLRTFIYLVSAVYAVCGVKAIGRAAQGEEEGQNAVKCHQRAGLLYAMSGKYEVQGN